MIIYGDVRSIVHFIGIKTNFVIFGYQNRIK